ncbi:type IV pilus biogenesis/stability protein PilW [Vibrio sp. Isolate25]|uniref:type IV pilus biogenesis/stability protein PilW n=1 Tax=Vibrio sp. Isolate25 TaxID=2908535 RepID=UPI001EFE6235|nr:type IV pilus biogenesis/stability protein PilW [Vibrio sp. Isolate25]MCG9597351.1 type IV pilus biogenesis/stability protein PilW [Vibrio sp. Isolate25]
MRFLFLFASLLLSACVTVKNPLSTSAKNHQADARIALGISYLQRGERVKARENLHKALVHSPSYFRAQLAMAHYLDHVSEYERANEMYQKAIRSQPSNGQILHDYGSFLCKQSRYNAAQTMFDKAIQQPDYLNVAASYESAAFCALKAEQTIQAMTYFKRAIAHDPKRTQSILNLAKLEIEHGKLAIARQRINSFHQEFGVRDVSLRLLMKLEQSQKTISPRP